KRPLLLTASSSGWARPGVEPSSDSEPSGATAKPETDPAAAFAVYANLPFLLTTSQHGAPWNVGTAPLITCAPSLSTAYEDAEPPASDTKARPRLSNANPNGVMPADGDELPGCARPATTA